MEINELVDSINKKLSENEYDMGPIQWNEEYYKALMAVGEILKPKLVMEIGHSYGDSAWALSQTSKRVISFDTYDVGRKKNIVPLCDNCDFVLLEDRNSCLDLHFANYDFIFIDIDHSGASEIFLHQSIRDSGYRGFVFWDDVLINDGMVAFWELVEKEKVITKWHKHGFGIVKY